MRRGHCHQLKIGRNDLPRNLDGTAKVAIEHVSASFNELLAMLSLRPKTPCWRWKIASEMCYSHSGQWLNRTNRRNVSSKRTQSNWVKMPGAKTSPWSLALARRKVFYSIKVSALDEYSCKFFLSFGQSWYHYRDGYYSYRCLSIINRFKHSQAESAK